ncbi:MAG: hypothetical protein NUW01_08210 [Gemmatimonadaceae bacterium]|nr:hypothetical protein [Gemmatimonadaceae bacterium]
MKPTTIRATGRSADDVRTLGFDAEPGSSRGLLTVTCPTCDAAWELDANAPMGTGAKLHLLNHKRGHA